MKFLFLLVLLVSLSEEDLVSNTTTAFKQLKCLHFSEDIMQKLHKCENCCGACDSIRCCNGQEPIQIDNETCLRYTNQGRSNFVFLLVIIVILIAAVIFCYFIYDYRTKNTEVLLNTMQSFISVVQTQNRAQNSVSQQIHDPPPPYHPQASSTSLSLQNNNSNIIRTRVSAINTQIESSPQMEPKHNQPILEITIIPSNQSLNIASTTADEQQATAMTQNDIPSHQIQ